MTDETNLTTEQVVQIEAIKAMAQDTSTQIPAPAPEPQQPETVQPQTQIPVQPTMPHTETFPVTGESVMEHPAVSLITEIEEHLGLLSMYGSVESHIRSLVAQLKSLF